MAPRSRREAKKTPLLPIRNNGHKSHYISQIANKGTPRYHIKSGKGIKESLQKLLGKVTDTAKSIYQKVKSRHEATTIPGEPTIPNAPAYKPETPGLSWQQENYYVKLNKERREAARKKEMEKLAENVAEPQDKYTPSPMTVSSTTHDILDGPSTYRQYGKTREQVAEEKRRNEARIRAYNTARHLEKKKAKQRK